jgi:hypothetical protein
MNRVLLSAAVVCGLAVTTFAAPSAKEIMTGVENRDQGKDMLAKITLAIKPKQGTERLRQFVLMRKVYKDMIKLVTFFLAPTDVRGAAFLAHDRPAEQDLRWLYLPTIGQVRQLSAESNRQSFFGSDFVYEDLTNRDPDLDEHKLVGTQKVDEWDCWVIESTPKNAKGLDFAKYKSWVWKTGSLIVRAEYTDGNGKLVRRGQVKTVKQVQDIWTWHQGIVEDLRTGSVTKMKIDEVKYNSAIPDERFAETQLNRGAPK